MMFQNIYAKASLSKIKPSTYLSKIKAIETTVALRMLTTVGLRLLTTTGYYPHNTETNKTEAFYRKSVC